MKNYRYIISTGLLTLSLMLSVSFIQAQTLCSCVKTTVKMLEEAKAVNYDQEKMKGLEEKYKAKMEKCEELGEGKSTEEKARMEEEMKACKSYGEMEALMEEMMAYFMSQMEEIDKPEVIEVPDEPEDLEISTALKTKLCNCIDITVELLEEAKSLNFDQEKMKGLEAKYKPQMQECEELDKGLSEQEKIALESSYKNCPNFSRIEVLSNEMMESMMKGMEPDEPEEEIREEIIEVEEVDYSPLDPSEIDKMSAASKRAIDDVATVICPCLKEHGKSMSAITGEINTALDQLDELDKSEEDKEKRMILMGEVMASMEGMKDFGDCMDGVRPEAEAEEAMDAEVLRLTGENASPKMRKVYTLKLIQLFLDKKCPKNAKSFSDLMKAVNRMN